MFTYPAGARWIDKYDRDYIFIFMLLTLFKHFVQGFSDITDNSSSSGLEVWI